MRNSLIFGSSPVGRGLEIALRDIPEYVLPPQPRAPSGRKQGAIVFGSGQVMCGQLEPLASENASRHARCRTRYGGSAQRTHHGIPPAAPIFNRLRVARNYFHI